MAITFFVPKFHLPAHIMECQTHFSWNFIPGVGQTDGEAPECGWANINPVTLSTKEMGPGAQRDTLDDHFDDWNWKKVVQLGSMMLRKVKEALPECRVHQEDLRELESVIILEEPSSLAEWKIQLEEWEQDRSKPNPYEVKTDTMMQATVHLHLAKEDSRVLNQGLKPVLHDEITPSILISARIDLEEQQRHLHVDMCSMGLHMTDTQEGKLLQRANTLQWRIDAWAKVQVLYMPSVSILRACYDTAEAIAPEEYPLWLPSSLGPLGLRCYSYLLKYKDHYLTGQSANTRAQNAVSSIQAKIDAACIRYNAARNAIINIAPRINNIRWQVEFCLLDTNDVRSMSDLLDGETQGTKSISWIWKMRGAATSEEDCEGSLEGMVI
ncbi:hypothetical protein AZE42_13202 [Rhizopogon vesiculosus]|uniref:Uncharacterized protein n=1 Tax=Rhizopogon vesiculosus TaxID=180088 RepID=A0A1J8R153_9AGAM|nr:hypothetical protein AZE42_13202 [Rhizopogon vesiculosus]